MLIEAHANLLEFTLASYEALCGLKKQPKMELQRHETAIKEAFERAHKLLKEGLGPKPRLASPTIGFAPLLRYCELGDSAEDAVARHMLVTRFGNQEAHRE
jgi:hypothetical protein